MHATSSNLHCLVFHSFNIHTRRHKHIRWSHIFMWLKLTYHPFRMCAPFNVLFTFTNNAIAANHSWFSSFFSLYSLSMFVGIFMLVRIIAFNVVYIISEMESSNIFSLWWWWRCPLEKFKFLQRVKQRRKKKLKQLHTFELILLFSLFKLTNDAIVLIKNSLAWKFYFIFV